MRKKIIVPAVIILAIVAYLGYNYVMAEPEDISKAKVDIELTSADFIKYFDANEEEAVNKFKEKVIVIKGTITAIENAKNITLDDKVNCNFENEITVNKGDLMKIKGLFIGVDELLGEIKLDKCSLVN